VRARLLRGAELILMTSPASTLDPIATAKIEELMLALKKTIPRDCDAYMQQAARFPTVR